MLLNKCKKTNTATNKTCDKGELHQVDMERSDQSLQVTGVKLMVPERPRFRMHREHDVKLPTYEESQAKYARCHKLKLVAST